MLRAYQCENKGLVLMADPASLKEAIWIDLLAPSVAEIALVAALGVEIPSLAEMEEIEISNRIYRTEVAEYLTIVLPGLRGSGEQLSGPVCFVLIAGQLITVRHHTPRPFETFPERANQTSIGCASPERVFLGLIQEVIGRQADHLEEVGRGLDVVARQVYQLDPRVQRPAGLQQALVRVGEEGERLSRVRLGLMTVALALNHFGQTVKSYDGHSGLGKFLTGQLKDVGALEVHADFLSSRIALLSDATLGMINLAQNGTVRIVSVVAVLFLPPTLIASVYGMNFIHMPELNYTLGYPMALGLMLGSAVLTWAYFHWRGWL